MRVGNTGGSGEGTKVLRARQLGNEFARVLDVELGSSTKHTRGKVQVEATLETLLDKLGVGGDLTESRVLDRDDLTLLVLLLALVELLRLLLGPEVLLGRIVRLVVGRKGELGSGHVHRVRGRSLIRVGPESVVARLVLDVRGGGSRTARNDATGTNGTDDLHDLLM